MKRILKFVISPEGLPDGRVTMPADSQILAVNAQKEFICVWILGGESAEEVTKEFEVYTTGQEIDKPEGLEFISTVFVGPLVLHVFERTVE